MVGVDSAGRADLSKVAAHRHHTQVLGGELDLGVERVKLPDALSSTFRFLMVCHAISSSFHSLAGHLIAVA
jgi:hypothetical protein